MIKFDQVKLKIVSIDEVRPNNWNPKDKETEDYKKIKKGIEARGQRMPIVVRENKGYEIIDGEQRWRSCKDLGFKEVLIYNEGEISDALAMELTIWYQQQVPFNEIELSGVIKKITESGADFKLPYLQEELDEYLKLAEFNFNEYETELENESESPTPLCFTLNDEQKGIVKEAVNKIKELNEVDDAEALRIICEKEFYGERE
jgi:ParB-like chromosome segregation protein Spo0J